MNLESQDIQKYINRDGVSLHLSAVHSIKEPEALAFENYGDRGMLYGASVPRTSNCTQCPAGNCCFASYLPGSILLGNCITPEIQDLVKYH